ncbi:hypothetical protein [Defluviitalea phaphyphila]|uniref:hypothetical protein n=1 Tax=Defluviitalea phaphyphila TaxID=1473580 RepID=UPI000730D209|nr:hypothetical protein [Defluviitalea phaphyphila]
MIISKIKTNTKILTKILFVVFIMQIFSLIVVIITSSIVMTKRIKNFANESEVLLANQIEKTFEMLFKSIELTLQGISRENSVTNILISEKYKIKILEDFRQYEEGNGVIKKLMVASFKNHFYQYPEISSVPKIIILLQNHGI